MNDGIVEKGETAQRMNRKKNTYHAYYFKVFFVGPLAVEDLFGDEITHIRRITLKNSENLTQ